ncbi:BEL1-like homeodomain protein 11 [Linum perenne]
MVNQDSPPHPASSMLHQFIISDNHHQSLNSYAQSLGLVPTNNSSIHHSLGSGFGSSHDSEMSQTRHFMDLLGPTNHHQQVQRLSLSLQGCQQVSNDDFSFTCNNAFASSSSSSSSNSYGTEYFFNAMKNSRYLRPAQLLLQEVASVGGKTVEISNETYVMKLIQSRRRGGLVSELRAELCSINGILQTAEKQELYMTISKLVALLEEVDGKYEKYYQQMEEVVSTFEEMAGLGASKSYTALALQAMSRHFCTLRDSIISQINATRRKLSQDLPTGMSQLSLLDKDGFRQNSQHGRLPLHQLGLLQCQRQQQWRPIRGLPETSVSILRSWLFEHFLNPYPNDSEKLMLASQTGLTKNQVAILVSNWFINARVRLWKPMIEEMYKEEFADSPEESSQLHGGEGSSSRAREDHSED